MAGLTGVINIAKVRLHNKNRKAMSSINTFAFKHDAPVVNGPRRQQEGGLRLSGVRKKSSPEKPLVSIITVVRNGASALERTIQSVINQTYDNIEYIVIDGASSDGTCDIIRKYSSSIDYWISEADNGLYDAMNKGIILAGGEWLYFLNSDDVLLNIVNEVALNLKDSNTIYYGDTLWRERNIVRGGKYSSLKLMFKNICHQAIFYPASAFKKYTYELNYKVLADYVMNIKCFTDKQFRFVYMPITLAVFNDKDGFSKCNNDTLFEAEKKNILKTYFSFYLYVLYITRKKIVDLVELFNLRKSVVRVLDKTKLKDIFIYK